MSDRISIREAVDCCGCNACGDICPKNAISFERDAGGFLYPIIDEGKCISCGLCAKTCPMLHVDEVCKNSRYVSEPRICAAISKNLSVRFDSTSGGIFTELAERIFEKGGLVGGAVWGEDFKIYQVVKSNRESLSELRSSKYAQSDARGFYMAVKRALDEGKDVMTCGTPCQMTALRLFLGKDYTNLVVVDFICRGINAPLVMKKYIEFIEKKEGKKVIAIKQKSKELGWHRLTTKFTFADGSIAYDPRESSLFMQGFLKHNLFCRASCYDCRFKGLPRLSDITLADCWGAVSDLDGVFNDDIGSSLVLCNSYKGIDFLKGIENRITIAQIDKEKVLKGNPCLSRSLERPKVNQAEFFSKLIKLDMHTALEQSFMSKLVPEMRWSILRKLAGCFKRIIKLRMSIFRLVRVNGFARVLFGHPLLYCNGRVLIRRAKSSRLDIRATTKIGSSIYGNKSKLESRLLMSDNSEFVSHGFNLSYGCDIELFSGARVEFGEGGYSNIGLTVICAKSIKIGKGVICGRNVTIRDTNGNHYLNTREYECTKPVEIGEHVWLCEHSSVMPGVHIGSGSVIAAGAVVTKDVPSNVLVGGVPARIIRTGVQWRA